MAAVPVTDAWSPREIAAKVRDLGVTKAQGDTLTVFVLAVLAGAFIGLGALLFTVVMTDPIEAFGAARLLGGVAFSLGLILVVVAGAELFTGNNLVAMAWASRLITTRALLRNWAIVYVGNAVGSVATVALVVVAGVDRFGGGGVGQTALAIGSAKAGLDPLRAFALGILCNALVCLAVWLTLGGRTVADKILAIIFPIAAFVAMGFEHSVANWFFLPYAIALDGFATDWLIVRSAMNLLFVTLGNIAGGTLLVAGVYWLAYLRQPGGSAKG